MHAPRRHYRRLLLPPGWVALGFLLLLGCQALLTHERQVRLPNVLGVTMPELKPDTTAMRLYEKEWFIPRKTPAEIAAMRPWHIVNLIGSPIVDFVANEAAEAAVRQINGDSTQAGGVCIRFQQHTTYANLIAVLDMMSRLNQKKYLLDIRHNPVALYAITDKLLPPSPARPPSFSCGTPSYMESYGTPVAAPTFLQLLANLWQQAWRPSMLLFVVITSLSIYRLARPRHLAR